MMHDVSLKNGIHSNKLIVYVKIKNNFIKKQAVLCKKPVCDTWLSLTYVNLSYLAWQFVNGDNFRAYHDLDLSQTISNYVELFS